MYTLYVYTRSEIAVLHALVVAQRSLIARPRARLVIVIPFPILIRLSPIADYPNSVGPFVETVVLY